MTDTETKNITLQVIKDLGEKVKLSDKENNLDLYCYTNCSNSEDELVKRCRGLVFNGEDLILQAFPYTEEYTTENDLSFLDMESFRFFDAYEGALLRVFNFDGKWYLSTHRKLNAFRSKWATKESFGSQFKKALMAEQKRNEKFAKTLPEGDNILESFYKTLDPKKQYMFLVLNNLGNRIVCNPPDEPTMYHVGTFVDGKLDMDVDANIPKPAEHKWDSVEDLLKYVFEIDYSRKQGVICFGGDYHCKVFHPLYQAYFQVRGNQPSLNFRYLQVRMDNQLCEKLYELYPEHAEMFNTYENYIYEVAQNIHQAYLNRYVGVGPERKKDYSKVPYEEFQVMKKCHQWYYANRGDWNDKKRNVVTVEKVLEVLNEEDPSRLNKMVRRVRFQNYTPEGQQPMNEHLHQEDGTN